MNKPCRHFDGFIASTGYGYWYEYDENKKRTVVYAHRRAYEIANGSIPPGWQVDHLCHNADASCPGGPSCPHRSCDEWTHLEAVPAGENKRRIRRIQEQLARTHCPKNHPYAGYNLIVRRGHRECRACVYARNKAARIRRRAERKAKGEP